MNKVELVINGEVKHSEEMESANPELVQSLEDKVDLLLREKSEMETKFQEIATMAIEAISDDQGEESDFVVHPGQSIMEAVLAAHVKAESTDMTQTVVIKEGVYHEQFNLEDIKKVDVIGEGNVLVDGRIAPSWIWAEANGFHTAIYPGFSGLWHWQGDHVEDAFNNRLMYPVLCTIGDNPLEFNPDGVGALEEGQFFIDSAPNKIGTITAKLKEGQSIGDFMVSPFDRLLWGNENTSLVSIKNIDFIGCSNTGKTGALSFPGTGWQVEDVSIDLANTIGIELGQGGLKSNMRGHVTDSTLLRVMSYRAGQQGWWGSAATSILEDCGHTGSNWRNFDIWWEASHKFENMHFCDIIRWIARDNNGPSLWFDGVYIDGRGGNTNNNIIDPFIENGVRTGIELELGTGNNTVVNPVVKGIISKTINPAKTWGQAVAIMIKGSSSGNKITGGSVSDCERVVLIDNTDGRGNSDFNEVSNIEYSSITGKPFEVFGDSLSNVLP